MEQVTLRSVLVIFVCITSHIVLQWPYCVCSESRVESFGRFVKDMDDSVKNLYVVGERSAKKHEDG